MDTVVIIITVITAVTVVTPTDSHQETEVIIKVIITDHQAKVDLVTTAETAEDPATMIAETDLDQYPDNHINPVRLIIKTEVEAL